MIRENAFDTDFFKSECGSNEFIELFDFTVLAVEQL